MEFAICERGDRRCVGPGHIRERSQGSFEPPGPPPDAGYETFDKDDPPETVGRMYAGFAVRYVMKEEEE